MDIVKKNCIIAEFMGYVNTTPTDKDFNIYENKEGNMIEGMSMQYHSNWNWLMDVVTKIDSIGFEVEIKNISCCIRELLGETIISLVCGDRTQKRSLVYDAIYDFIVWYNQKEKLKMIQF